MKYMGSKARIASNIAPILMELYHQNECEVFIDCTVGGANLLEAIPESIPRYGIDNNEYLIEMWQAVSLGWMPQKHLQNKIINIFETIKTKTKS